MGFFGGCRRVEKAPLRGALCLFALISSLFVSACGGAAFDGREYRSEEFAFRLGPLPPGLRSVTSSDAELAFRDDTAGATWAISGRCHLDGDDVPLRALVEHLFLQFTDREVIAERSFRLDGRDAMEVELIASIDGVARHFLIAVLKKDSCVYDFVHVDPGAETPEERQSRQAFRQMVAGFSVLRTGAGSP